eukprot:1972027-Alexandrium_andersonii.AAC.1
MSVPLKGDDLACNGGGFGSPFCLRLRAAKQGRIRTQGEVSRGSLRAAVRAEADPGAEAQRSRPSGRSEASRST